MIDIHRTDDVPNSAACLDMQRLATFEFLVAADARVVVLSRPDVPRVGSEVWLRWDTMRILPVALGLRIVELTEGSYLKVDQIHGPFLFADYEVRIVNAFAGDSSVLAQRVRCKLPWWFGGVGSERLTVHDMAAGLMAAAAGSHQSG